MAVPDLSAHMTVMEVFPNAMQSAFHPDAEHVNKGILEAASDIRETVPSRRPDDWACDVYTTIESNNELQTHPSFQSLTMFAEEEMKYFSETHKIFLPEDKVFIKNMWINIYKKNCSMDIHHHPNSLFSGVYFVNVPDNAAQFAFDSPSTQEMIHIPIKTPNQYNIKNASFTPFEGELILFNSFIKHRVFLHEVEEERVTVSFTATI